MKDEVTTRGSEQLSQLLYKRTKDYNYIEIIKLMLKVNQSILCNAKNPTEHYDYIM